MRSHRALWMPVLALAVVASGLAGRPLAQALAAPAAPAQSVQSAQSTRSTMSLAVTGDVPSPLTLTPADLKAMPRTTVTVSTEGRDVKYDGVLVGEVLKRAGAVGRDLTGMAAATYVLASATDGYQAVFSLAELDNGFTGNNIIIADTVDGKPLFDYQGPFRIVAPRDKGGSRSVRMLERLDVVQIKKPK